MRSIKAIGLAAVMAMALMATAGAATAFAAAEYFRNGSPLAEEVTFSGTSGAGKLQIVSGTTLNCSSDEVVNGKLLNSTDDEVEKVVFKGCKGPLGVSCTSPGQSSGVIVTGQLKSKLVNLVGGGVGVRLEPKTAGALFSEFTCFLTTIKVKGSVVGVASPLNEQSTAGTLTFSETAGVQEPSEYELGGETKTATLESSVGGGAYEESGIESTDSLTFAKAVEVRE